MRRVGDTLLSVTVFAGVMFAFTLLGLLVL